MNREALEHLIIDRRLGELSDDVASLLDAYLQASPSDEVLAGEIESDLALAQEALRPAASEDLPLPAFPTHRVADALSAMSPPRSGNWQRPLALAAVLALGVFIGVRMSASQVSSAPRVGPVAFHDSAVASGDEDDFWSLRAERSSRSKSKNSTKPVEWNSPLHWPVKGESL